jgi:hypothetical protein
VLAGDFLKNGQFSWVVFEPDENHWECCKYLFNSVWSTIGHCVNYFGVVFANYPGLLPGFLLVWAANRNVAEMTPINNADKPKRFSR